MPMVFDGSSTWNAISRIDEQVVEAMRAQHGSEDRQTGAPHCGDSHHHEHIEH